MRNPMSISVRVLLVVLALSTAPAGSVFAQDGSVRVTATAEPMEVEVGEPVVFAIEVRGAPVGVIQPPDRPAAANLELQQGAPTRRRTHSSEGGALRRTVTFSWRFRPQAAGTARIRPVSVLVRGEAYTTGEIRVRVNPRSDTLSAPRLRSPEGSAAETTLDERDLFVRASASDDRAYQNEQVVVEYRLFYRPGVRLRHSRLAGAWDAPGFWREELDVASRPTPQPRRASGRTYETVMLKRVALFPTRPGTLHIDPLRIETEAQGTVRMQRGGPSFRGRFQSVKLASRSLSLQVRPLPSGAPSSFDGAVGQFSITARADADSVTVGDAVPLTVRVRGRGNLPTLSAPPVEVPSAVERYEPTVETEIDRTGRWIQGTKIFTYPLVPRSAGRHALPAVPFSYFDPEAERYVTLRAEGPILEVSEGSGSLSQRVSGRTGEGLPVADVAEVMGAEEARWVRTDRRPLYRRPWDYLLLLIPVLLAGGGLVSRRWGREDTSSTGEAPEAALDAARTQLQEAHRRLEKGAEAAVYDVVEQTLRDFLSERLEMEEPSPSRRDLVRPLTRHDAPEELQDALYELLDRCDEARYAPGCSTHSVLTSLLDEAEVVLRRLDEYLPSSSS